MSTEAISSASTIASAATNYIKQTAGSNDTSSALEEATETATTTAKEAAHGDPVAKRLIARQQQEQQLQNPAPAKEPGKGEEIDQKA